MRDVLQRGRPARTYGVDRTGGLAVVYADPDDLVGTSARVWPRALPPHRSSCRIDASKGLRQHRCSRSHTELVDGYRAWREAAEQAAEAATNGYATELAEYWQQHERPTLKAYLQGTGRTAADQ